MSSRLRSASILLAAVGAGLLVPSAAHADPPTAGNTTLTLHCGADTFDVVIAGNGNFTPAHDLNSPTVFIPTSFGETTGTITVVDTGAVIDSFTAPATWKGQATRPRSTSVSCTFTSTEQFFDPGLQETLQSTFTGSVEGFYTPARP